MKTFTEKANYPFTYGDKTDNDVMLSDYVVELVKNKRFQSHVTAISFALLTIGSYARPSVAIPPEYGEAANDIINQAAQNGGLGGVPAAPAIGPIEGQVPGAQGNPQFFIPAMPVQQQRLLAAQQMGQPGPANAPVFYIPNRPMLNGPRAANTVAFTTALGVICLNAAWGEPVAIMMCSSGLVGIAYKLAKEVVLFMVKNLN